MRRFEIRRINEDLTSHSGLALVGCALQRSGMATAVNRAAPLRHGIRHGDVLGAYIGLLSLGKHDFDAVEECGRAVSSAKRWVSSRFRPR